MPHRIHKYSALKTQGFVIKALFKRQMITRFGKYKLGAVWMLVDPLISVIVLGLILGPLIGRSSGIIPYPFFLLCGFMLLRLITGPIKVSNQAISSNAGLLVFKQVQPLDVFLSRYLFEFCSTSLAFLIFCLIGAWLGIELSLNHVFLLILCLLITWLLGCGIGLIMGIAAVKMKELEKIITYVQRPLLFISAVLYPSISIPGQYREFLLYNPLVHTIEYARYCLFPHYDIRHVNLTYPLACALVFLTLGMMNYRNNRHYLTQR